MKRLQKTLILFIACVALSVLALWIFTQSISPDTIRNLLNKRITAMSGLPSEIRGAVNWHLFPRPGIHIESMQIGDSLHSELAVSIENLIINMQFSPLFKGMLVFDELKVDGFNVSINQTKKVVPALKKPVKFVKKSSEKASAQFAIDQVLLTRGTVTIVNGSQKLTVLNLQMGATKLNLEERYFPVQLKGTLSSSLPHGAFSSRINFKGRVQLSPQILKGGFTTMDHCKLEGQVFAQNTQINRIKIAKINANVVFQSNELALKPLNLNLYQGKSVGELHYQRTTNKLAFNQTGTAVNAAPFLKAVFGEALLNGDLDFSVRINGFLRPGDWYNNFQSDGNFTVKEGQLNFVDIEAIIKGITSNVRRFLATATKPNANQHVQLATQKNPENPALKTKFKLLNLQYRLENTAQLSESFLLQTDNLELNSSGDLNLSNYTINNRLALKLISTNATLNKMQNLLNGSFPLQLSGTLSEPTILPDMAKITPVISGLPLKNTLSKPIKKFQSDLKGLLSNAKLIPTAP